ncbi:MAG: tRNA (guanosine(46)-N7)-methyltransferase TrmB [Gammaproteobacteria bacterium]|nr:MAG: tRNA (guanosine(46)-N7)-methyltransferase TrmB [Gammaproteobacteria bacterium]
MTPAQRRALERLWPRYGLELPEEGELDLEAAFGRRAPRVLDIGFGDGTALAAQARGRPGWDFLGVEVHRPGVGRLLHTLEREGIGNVRVLGRDVLELLRRLPPGAFQRVQLYFPDPWPKKRHHKRRLVQGPFLEGARRVLAPGGLLHLATDWEGYAAWMEEQVAAAGGFLPAARERLDPGEALEEAARAARAARLGRPETKFERRARAEGRPIWDLLYRKA